MSLITITLINNSNCSHPFPLLVITDLRSLSRSDKSSSIHIDVFTRDSTVVAASPSGGKWFKHKPQVPLLRRITKPVCKNIRRGMFWCCILFTPHYLLGRNSIQTWHQEKCFPKTKDEIIVFHSESFTFMLHPPKPLTHPLIRLTRTRMSKKLILPSQRDY